MSINVFPPEGGSNEINPMLIDPVSKFRVSNPENLIDTDFEYGLQPTKWETVEIINNTPAFFSKGGDTTIPDITGITTNAGTREITVTTAFPHGLSAGIPIRVDGTKSVTADGSYIINATPSITTFTYLSKANQADTVSIFDLYTSIITGEFFQGSQISISDSAGITTDGEGPTSELTIKTKNKHGFGLNTPFYFLNLNSTISQEFEAQNTSSVSFDPTNSAVAQTFDGSNTANQLPIDFSNSASTQIIESNVTSVDTLLNTITVDMDGASWSGINIGDPLYYDVSAVSGYFRDNPRGVVFIKIVFGVGETSSTFQVSALPNGSAIPITGGISGYFQLADRAKTFPGNNVNQETQINLSVEDESEFLFDGGNQGYVGEEQETPPDNTLTITGVNAVSIIATGSVAADYYVGAMVKYETTGTDITGLTADATYFIETIADDDAGTYTLSLSELPGGPAISVSGVSGTHTLSRIGISIDRDIFHIKDSNFDQFEMLEYSFPVEVQGDPGDLENPVVIIDGNFGASKEKKFYFVTEKFDQHNYRLLDVVGEITPATQSRIDTDAGTEITPTEVNVVGFTQPYTFAVTSGTLPTGLVLNTSTGVISGTPSAVLGTPTREVVITLTDVNSFSGSQSITFQFNPQPELYAFTSVTFTPGGATAANGPSIAQVRSGAGNPSWGSQYLNMSAQAGVFLWTVPATATYRITAAGAQGGRSDCYSQNADGGAQMRGDFELSLGQVLKMVVGQRGISNCYDGGGGGGSFVANSTNNSPLIVAGGAGGSSASGFRGSGANWGRIEQAGHSTSNGTGGSNGNGGSGATAGGGGGFFGNGGGSWFGTSFTNGARGGLGQAQGGFGGGGGGGGTNGAGGGGGYGGGSYSRWSFRGGGAGSINNGTNQANANNSRFDNGFITVTKL